MLCYSIHVHVNVGRSVRIVQNKNDTTVDREDKHLVMIK